jgi:putative transposase
VPLALGATGGLPASAERARQALRLAAAPQRVLRIHANPLAVRLPNRHPAQMSSHSGRHKTIKHFHEPGDFHELTFSCYHRMPLLTNDPWRLLLAQAIQRAIASWQFQLHAYVFMPEHVHLLVFPLNQPDISGLLKAIKNPYSYRIKQLLIECHSPLLERLTVRERPGKTAFRFWQEGPGYDRNLQTQKAVLASVAYIHNNPVRRGLCEKVTDWRWSSARFYASDGCDGDVELPLVGKLPAEFLT